MDDVRVKRARLRAWRRGFLEADLIFGPFADAHAHELGESDLASLERLLEANEQDVWAWVRGEAPVPAAYDDALFARLRAFALDRARTV
ncbi:MAG TPA: succinate dehydrogenase assembly factor 2 [Caulobacteraceae bacterium]|nr:succinate dehydrogenase assembly factor 2 [Caulobacteraceae bacterium]